MSKKIPSLMMAVVWFGSSIGRADFKYTETSKMTGGMMMGAMKMVGVFSKDARNANKPMESTTYVKGNRMRREESDDKVEIIDLDGRRFIHVDPSARTYSVMTFDQMKAAMQDAQARAKQQQPQQTQQNAPKVTMTPKIEISDTGNSTVILGAPAKEHKMKMEMEMQTDDPKYKGQSATIWVTSDEWVGSVKGYEEVSKFYQRMAKEMQWVPGVMMGGNLQINTAMTEFHKGTANVNGFPLVAYTSVGMGGTVPAPAAGGTTQAQPGTQSQNPQPSEQTSSGDLKSKAVSTMLGGFGFGKKKKAEPASQPSTSSSSSETAPAGAFTSGSMMDMVTEVASFSSDPLDGSLFDVPAGYTQVQPEMGKPAASKPR